MVTLTSLGGAGTVTGSKHLLEQDGHRVLVDCGLFQGLKNLRELNWSPLPVDAASIDAVVLTHAHLDHTGYLPRLVNEGFRGPIVCSAGTRDVADLILKDSARLLEQEADFLNRRHATKHHPALPLYREEDAEHALKLFQVQPFHQPIELAGGATVTLRRAGHILGASTVDIEWGGQRVVLSGDLGRYDDPVMRDPEPIPQADYVVVESTYGNRVHDVADPAEALAQIVDRTAQRGGTVIIPAFAVGRTQLLLYYLWKLRSEDRLPDVPIYLDSPMAISASELLHKHRDDHRLAPDVCDAVCDIATYTRDTEASKRISANHFPKIVVSASGMVTGGRVLHHLAAFATDPRNSVLFTGFQAAGTRGRAMVEGARDIKIHGKWIHVRAEVEDLPTLSAHADSTELIQWLSTLSTPPRRAFIVHGEAQASEAFRSAIDHRLGWEAVVPRQNQVFAL